jgi:hypothetical protein
MRTFANVGAQGDVMLRRRVDAVPSNAARVAAVDGVVIVTHSETGHHHTMTIERADDPAVEMFQSRDNPLLAWLKVRRPTALEHNRHFDIHESLLVEPGVYEVRRQREHAPEGWRQVAD